MSYRTVALGDITRWHSGGTPNRSVAGYWNGTIPWISASTLKAIEIAESEQHITPEGLAAGSRIAEVGSTLLLVRGSALHNEIRAGLVVAPVSFNQDVKALVPSPNIHPKFLTYSLLGRSDDLLKLVSTAGNTAGVLDTKLVQAFEINLPPLPEQLAITKALSAVDRLLGAQEALIAKKAALKHAVMQQLLTGATRLPGFSGEWELTTLGTCGMTYGGITGKSKADFGQGSARYVTFLNVLENAVVQSSLFHSVDINTSESQNRVLRGDVLFNGTSETPNDLALGSYVDQDYDDLYLNSFCFGFRFHNDTRHEPLFFAYFFRGSGGRKIMRALAQGATRYNMSKRQFLNLESAIPDGDEQRAIATVLSDMDAEIAALEVRRDKTKAIKQGMMQQLLTGRIRLMEREETV